MACDFCDDREGGCCFPHYGLAPHWHDLSKTGSILGSTVIDPKETWPENFDEDPEAPGLGTYAHCPKCGAP